MNAPHTTRNLSIHKIHRGQRPLSMLTCYDYQSAQILAETNLDMILVGDSVGNVILGYDTTVPVTLEVMILFGQAVRRGAPEKFLIVDLPFGAMNTYEEGLKNATLLFQQTNAQAVKIEGAFEENLRLIKRLTELGVPVMGHIGLTPQSVHQLGGYYTHGKNEEDQERLLKEAKRLEEAGAFAVVLECVDKELARKITRALIIPTIGIGAGSDVDGQVLVINDLLHLGRKAPPKFCTPVAKLFELKKKLLNQYINEIQGSPGEVGERTSPELSL